MFYEKKYFELSETNQIGNVMNEDGKFANIHSSISY